MKKQVLRLALLCLGFVVAGWTLNAFGSGSMGAPGGHGTTVAGVLVALVVILLGAKIGGACCNRFGQPEVLGELVIGVVIGNLFLVGLDIFEPLKTESVLEIFAEIGVILLLFEVGLESRLGEMMKVGLSALLVATLGVITPFFLGWGVGAWFLPESSIFVHIFLGATLTATSVGITARVLKDLNKIDTKEARIILGAAVIDDVMGLIILAVFSGIIIGLGHAGEGLSSAGILWIVAKAILFLGGAILAGQLAYRPLFRIANRLRAGGMLLISSLAICFTAAWLANLVGLAPIVGAFAAGLVLDEVQYNDLGMAKKQSLAELLRPIGLFLIPIFFVYMGLKVDIRAFGQSQIIVFALILTAAAIIGKQASAFGVLGKGMDRFAVGLGMIPRGEVGLIFANIGAGLSIAGQPVISPDVFSAVVIMVIITTMITPPVLKWKFSRNDKA
jgi:Kef-type K+ transport system membrane component KefB